VSSTTMVLTTPTSGGTLSQDPNKPSGLTNPLLSFNDGLKTTSAILIQAMNTPEVVKDLTGGGAKLVVDDGKSNASLLGVNGPFIYIEGSSTNPDEARSVVQRAQQKVRDELVNRQKALNAPPSTYITIADVVSPSLPQVQRGLQLQFAVAGLVITILGGIAGAYGAERIFAARRRRTATPSAQAASAQSPAPAPVPVPPVRATPPRPTTEPAIDPATVRFSPVPHPATNGNQVTIKHPPVPAPAPAKNPATAHIPAPSTNHPAPGHNSGQPTTNGVDAPMPKPIRSR